MQAKIISQSMQQALLVILCCLVLPGFMQPKPKPALTLSNNQQIQPDSELANQAALDPALLATDTISDTTTMAPFVTKPAPLSPIPGANPDPLPALDLLITKQHVSMAPYVPFIQAVFMGVDCGRLAMNAWYVLRNLQKKDNAHEHDYLGSLGILFRKNIQLSGNLGHAQFHPQHTSDNTSQYKVNGWYGRIGIDYVISYHTKDNLYAGLRYGSSYFTNSTKPQAMHEKAISKNLSASWVEFVVGSETQLWQDQGFYTGLAIHLGKLYDFQCFEPANNYVIPGYGRTKNKLILGLSLYIQYKLSFLNRLISFN